MKTFKQIFLVILIICFVFLSSCSEEVLYKIYDEHFDNGIQNLFTYQTNITVEFESADDISKFESRLKAFDYSIVSKQQFENSYRYCINNRIPLYENEWELLENSYNASIVDSNGQIVLGVSDIDRLLYTDVDIRVYMDDDFWPSYDLEYIKQTDFCIDDVVYEMYYPFVEYENGKYISYMPKNDDEKDVLIKFTAAYASEPYSATVNINYVDCKLIH
ncbi:MAG: hypothetical protein IKU23_01340 [Clostridia bacterium]|nr:hypothetical protein [Clostridia bacterium]